MGIQEEASGGGPATPPPQPASLHTCPPTPSPPHRAGQPPPHAERDDASPSTVVACRLDVSCAISVLRARWALVFSDEDEKLSAAEGGLCAWRVRVAEGLVSFSALPKDKCCLCLFESWLAPLLHVRQSADSESESEREHVAGLFEGNRVPRVCVFVCVCVCVWSCVCVVVVGEAMAPCPRAIF